eukprot:gene30510-34440_t
MQRSIFAARKLSVRLNGLGQNTRKFSEYFHPFPSTAATPDGLYLMHAVKDSEFSTVKAALESGVDPNFRAEENLTPLMVAAESNKLPIVQTLIRHGADVNLQDDLGETALMKAARSAHKEVVELLLREGAQTDIFNYEQMTAREATLDVEVDEMLAGTAKLDSTEANFN